jgi:hypothetical protein
MLMPRRKVVARMVTVRDGLWRPRLSRAMATAVIGVATAAPCLSNSASATAGTTPDCLRGMPSPSYRAPDICTDLLPLQSTTEMRFGGTEYNYVGPDNRVVSLTVPSPSFNSATASPAELREAGVPPEPPSSSPEYPKWEAMIKAGIQFARPEATLGQSVEQLPASSLGASDPASSTTLPTQAGSLVAEEPSPNWSGYLQFGGEGHFTKADLYYKDTANKHDSCESGGFETETSIWAGLGGNYRGAPLAQTGTLMGNSVHKGVIGEQEAWFEVPLGEPTRPEPYKMPLTVRPGDWVQADVQYNGHEEYSFFVEDLARHEATHAIGRGKVDANVADFIIERSAPENLVNVGDVPMQGFTNNKVFAENRQKIQRETLINGNGETMAKPGQVLSNNYEFFDKYENRCLDEELGSGLQGTAEHAPPTATTEPAESVGGSSATLKGIVNPEGQEARYSFEYGTEEYNYSGSTPELSAGSGSSPVNVSSAVTGLSPGTTYHYRVIADGAGGIAAGADHTFKTTGTPPPPPPSVTTEGTSGVTTHTATLEASVNPNGLDTHYYFEYGTASGLYESDAPVLPGNDAGSGTSALVEKVEVTGLEQHTTYYYRVVASNATGTSYGSQQTFKTPGWEILMTPKAAGEHTRHDQLLAVSCASGTMCAGVGSFLTEEFAEAPLSENWNGSSWSVQAAPAPTGAVGTYPEAVSCSSSTACTSTGRSREANTNYHLFAERLSGSSWSLQSPAMPETTSATLADVSCPTSKECYAAGWYYKTSSNERLPIVERWSGGEWTIFTTATLPSEDKEGSFSGVSCFAAKKCMAVGTYDSTTLGIQPLVERLSGTKWTWQTLTGSGLLDAELAGVSCTAVSACTAAGHNHEHTMEALIARWNGTSWTLQSSPSPTGKPAEIEAGWALTQVSCAAATVCVATGWYKEKSSEARQLLGEVWNGTAWSLVPPVARVGAATNEITGLSCPTKLQCFATGYTENSGKSEYESLAEELEGF